MFKSQGRGVNLHFWAVTFQCSEAIAPLGDIWSSLYGRGPGVMALPSAAFLYCVRGGSSVAKFCCLCPGQRGAEPWAGSGGFAHAAWCSCPALPAIGGSSAASWRSDAMPASLVRCSESCWGEALDAIWICVTLIS